VEAKIGNRLVESIKPQEHPYQIHDTEIRGFLLRVQPSGVMTYYYEYRLPSGLKNRIKIEKHGKITPIQARDRVKEIAADLVKGVDPKAAKREAKIPLLREFIEKMYLPWAESNLKSGTTNVSRLRSRFVHLLDKQLDDPKLPWLLEEWKTERLKVVTKLTINRDLTVLKGAFSYAVRHQAETGLQKNPLSEVKLFKINEEESERIRYLNQNGSDEEERLISAIDAREKRIRAERQSANAWRQERSYVEFPSLDQCAFVDYMKPMVLLSLNTGMRRGEIFKICWNDINWNQGTPVATIRGSIAKNGKSRSIPLNKVAEASLNGWMRQQSDLNGLVFPSHDGKPFNTIKTCWNKIILEAKLIDFRWHDLRHTFASRLVMKGVDLNTVRELLGHSDLKMTLRYAHLSPKKLAAAVAQLDLSTNIHEEHPLHM